MSNVFDACWERCERAQVHRNAAMGVWNEYIADHDAFEFELHHKGSGVFVLHVHQTRPSPPELAIEIGEWLYNLRATLDYTIWAAACYASGTVPPSDAGVLQYPIYDTPEAWTKNLYRLRAFEQYQVDRLHTMQPFASDLDANYLGWLNRLARLDRHRTLVTGAARIAELEPVFGIPAGSTVKVEWGERTIVDGRADALRVTVTPCDDPESVQVNPRIGIDPELAEWSSSEFWGPKSFSDRLRYIEVFVAGEVAVWEYESTGIARKPGLLTEGFRAECDARPRQSSLRSKPRPAVTWREAGDARESTEDRFYGRDFPADGPGPKDSTERLRDT